jgi:hypothetical protein
MDRNEYMEGTAVKVLGRIYKAMDSVWIKTTEIIETSLR